MTRTRRGLLWAAWSLAAIGAGAFGPWASRGGRIVDGTDDELVEIIGLVAVAALVAFFLRRSRTLAAVLLLAGVISATIVGGDVTDPAGPFGGPGPNIHLDWGIWTVLAGSGSLVLASIALIRHAARRRDQTGPPEELALSERIRHQARLLNPRIFAPTRDALLRAQRARMAERAAEAAKRTTVEAAARERAFRMEFAEVAGRLTPHVAVEIAGLVYFLPARQKFGVGRFSSLDWKEHRHLERALDVLRRRGVDVRGTTFVDVGANIGTTIVPALARHKFGAGYAIEPEAENVRLLRINLAANGLDGRVTVVKAAASNSDGAAELVLRPLSGGKHHVKTDESDEGDTVSVPRITLDSLVRDGRLDPSTVGMLWLDIQGHELEALEGAKELLNRSVPIVMEFDTRRLDDARLDAFRTLLRDGYTCVVDLSRHEREQVLVPLDELGQLVERHAGTFTDLLAIRA